MKVIVLLSEDLKYRNMSQYSVQYMLLYVVGVRSSCFVTSTV